MRSPSKILELESQQPSRRRFAARMSSAAAPMLPIPSSIPPGSRPEHMSHPSVGDVSYRPTWFGSTMNGRFSSSGEVQLRLPHPQAPRNFSTLRLLLIAHSSSLAR